jgi:hypothetical protein
MEELGRQCHTPAYDWKSVHVEAELVKLGLEEKQRGPSGARKRRVHIPARHRGRHTKSSSVLDPMSYYKQQRHPAVFHLTPVVDGQQKEMSAGISSYDMLSNKLNAYTQPALTEKQHENLIDECFGNPGADDHRAPQKSTVVPARESIERTQA